MKRQQWRVLLGAVILITACWVISWLVFKYAICDGTQALQNMDRVLQDVRNNPNGTPSENLILNDLRRWLAEAPGQYRLVLLGLDDVHSPGNDATVGLRLSSGVNVVCTFYNGVLESCDKVGTLPLPEVRDVEDMKTVLHVARDNPTGLPPKEIWWTGLASYRTAPHVWEDLQRWMANAPGDYQIEVPAHDDYQCGYVSYTVKAHLSNGKAIACEFEEREIRSCEEVKP